MKILQIKPSTSLNMFRQDRTRLKLFIIHYLKPDWSDKADPMTPRKPSYFGTHTHLAADAAPPRCCRGTGSAPPRTAARPAAPRRLDTPGGCHSPPVAPRVASVRIGRPGHHTWQLVGSFFLLFPQNVCFGLTVVWVVMAPWGGRGGWWSRD